MSKAKKRRARKLESAMQTVKRSPTFVFPPVDPREDAGGWAYRSVDLLTEIGVAHGKLQDLYEALASEIHEIEKRTGGVMIVRLE